MYSKKSLTGFCKRRCQRCVCDMFLMLADILIVNESYTEVIVGIIVMQLQFNFSCIMMNCTDDLKLPGSTDSLDPSEFGNSFATDTTVRMSIQQCNSSHNFGCFAFLRHWINFHVGNS